MKPPTNRQRVLAELRSSTVPLRASEIVVRLDSKARTVRRSLAELHSDGAAMRSAGCRWVAADGRAEPRSPLCDRALAELAQAPRPLLGRHLALRIGADIWEIRSCLRRLRREGLVTYVHPWRWALTSKAPEVLPVPPVAPIDRVRGLIATGGAWQVEQVAAASGVSERTARATLRLLVGKGEAACVVDRVTGARTWQAVRP